MLEKYIFNKLINNIDYELLYKKEKTSFYINNNSIYIKLDKQKNDISISLNWLNVSWNYKLNDYWNYIQELSNLLSLITLMYIQECKQDKYNINDILEFWED